MEEILKILPYMAPILTALAGIKWGDWILDKLNIKKKKAEVENNSLDNLKKNLDLYQEIVDDLNQKYKERIIDFEQGFNQTIDRLKLEVGDLREINKELEIMIKDQKAFIARQSKSLTYYEHKYGKLNGDN